MELENYLLDTFELRDGVLYRKYRSGWKPATLSPTTLGYYRVGLKGNKQITVHRLVWFLLNKEFPDGEIDHIDGIRANNRPENLRLTNKTQNQSNRLPNKKAKSVFKGVYPYGDKWIASISFEGVRHYLGIYTTESDAAKAYNIKAEELDPKYRKKNNVNV